MVVVFPAPFGPRRPKMQPSGIVIEKSCIAVTDPNVLVNLSQVIIPHQFSSSALPVYRIFRFLINLADELNNLSLTSRFKAYLFIKNRIVTDDKNYLQNFIYSFLFLPIGMPDNDNVGADVLSSGKG